MFRFKKFNIEHDRSSMKVGTDGVLLGAWTDVSGAKRALDVGTGCGVISLMLAQRASELFIDAIDIDRESVLEASFNFERCPWNDRLCAKEGDFNSLDFSQKYDLIVSNPPFFTNGIMSQKESRMNARHTVTLTYSQLLARAKTLLNNSGILSIVSPASELDVILESCKVNNLFIKRIVNVLPRKNMPVKRILWEFSIQPVKCTESALVIEESIGVYTDEFRKLCSDFYLKL